MDTIENDRCCYRHLAKALRSGSLDNLETWTHEKCGQEWRAVEITPTVRHWAPVLMVEIIPAS